MNDGAEDWEWNESAEAAPIIKEDKKEDLLKSTNGSNSSDDKKIRLRQACLSEILDSEVKYLRDLYTLSLYYVTPLRGEVGKKFPELFSAKNGAVTVLFSTIELIFDGNTELNDKLKEQLSSNSPMFGSVFLNQIEKLCQYYGVFCNHQKEAMLQIEELLKSLPPFKQFEDSCKSQPEVNGLGLLDFLVKPFQRLLKYPLLLNELLKNTPEDYPDRPNIQQAIQKLQEEVDVINTNKAKSDNMKKVIDLNQQIEQLPRGFKLLIPSRRFVFDGTLQKISGNHDQERHFFLFNDCLVYCKKKGPNKYICRGVIYLNQLKLEDTGDPVSFKISRTDKNLTYVLYGSSKREKDVWMHEIKACQQTTNVLSRSRSLTDVGKKEIVRLFTDAKTFKSIAGTPVMTCSELAAECLRKLGSKDSPEDYVIVAHIKEKDIPLSSGDFPLQLQVQYVKQGIKFGNDVNHFKLVKASEAPLPPSSGPLLRSLSPDSKSREDLRSTMRSKNNISTDNLKTTPAVVTTVTTPKEKETPIETPKEGSNSAPSTLTKTGLIQSVPPTRPTSKPTEPQRSLSPGPQRSQLPPPPRPLSPPPPRPLSPSPQRAVSPPPSSSYYESNVPRLATKTAQSPPSNNNNRALSPPPPPKPSSLTIPKAFTEDRNSNSLTKSTGPKNPSASLSPPPQRPPSTKTTTTAPAPNNPPVSSNGPKNLRAYHSTLKRPANPMDIESEDEIPKVEEIKKVEITKSPSGQQNPSKVTTPPAKQTSLARSTKPQQSIYGTSRTSSGSTETTPPAPNPGGATMRPNNTRNLNRPLPPPPQKTKTM